MNPNTHRSKGFAGLSLRRAATPSTPTSFDSSDEAASVTITITDKADTFKAFMQRLKREAGVTKQIFEANITSNAESIGPFFCDQADDFDSQRNAKRTGLELVDNLPVIGLIKAGVHGALGQHRRARTAAIRGGLSTVLTVPAVAVPFVSGPAIAAAVGSNIARLAAVNAAIASSLIVVTSSAQLFAERFIVYTQTVEDVSGTVMDRVVKFATDIPGLNFVSIAVHSLTTDNKNVKEMIRGAAKSFLVTTGMFVLSIITEVAGSAVRRAASVAVNNYVKNLGSTAVRITDRLALTAAAMAADKSIRKDIVADTEAAAAAAKDSFRCGRFADAAGELEDLQGGGGDHESFDIVRVAELLCRTEEAPAAGSGK
jgi:hypothetical protein